MSQSNRAANHQDWILYKDSNVSIKGVSGSQFTIGESSISWNNCANQCIEYATQDDGDHQPSDFLEIEVHTSEEDNWDAGDPVYRCIHCNACMWDGERLAKSKRNRIPRFALCCMDGKIQLPFLTEVPALLHDLHYGEHEKGRYFRKNIRNFNSMFAFTLMVGKISRSIKNGTAPPIFSINGQNYHTIGSLIPQDNNRPRFAQLYIYDTDNKIQNRINAVRSSASCNAIETQIVDELKQVLDTHNPLSKIFRSVRDRFNDVNLSNIRLKLIKKRDTDGRVYNLPTTSEVAILIAGDIDESLIDKDIILESTTNKLQRIDVLHPLYLALHYPLVFLYGEDGFRTDIATSSRYDINDTKKRKNITMREFFSDSNEAT